MLPQFMDRCGMAGVTIALPYGFFGVSMSISCDRILVNADDLISSSAVKNHVTE